MEEENRLQIVSCPLTITHLPWPGHTHIQMHIHQFIKLKEPWGGGGAALAIRPSPSHTAAQHGKQPPSCLAGRSSRRTRSPPSRCGSSAPARCASRTCWPAARRCMGTRLSAGPPPTRARCGPTSRRTWTGRSWWTRRRTATTIPTRAARPTRCARPRDPARARGTPTRGAPGPGALSARLAGKARMAARASRSSASTCRLASTRPGTRTPSTSRPGTRPAATCTGLGRTGSLAVTALAAGPGMNPKTGRSAGLVPAMPPGRLVLLTAMATTGSAGGDIDTGRQPTTTGNAGTGAGSEWAPGGMCPVGLHSRLGREVSPVARVTVTRPRIPEAVGMYPAATAGANRWGNRCSLCAGMNPGSHIQESTTELCPSVKDVRLHSTAEPACHRGILG